MGLNAEQKAAVEYLNGPLLVLAGPGTGKTQLLSEKVAYILKTTDTNPENILCITFTDSGASNMRERLSSVIGVAANDVNIYTYHKFGSAILERYKNYSDSYDRRIDNPIDEVTQFKIIHEIQQNLPVTDILKTTAVKSLVETIAKAKSARLSADDLIKIAQANIADSKQISEIATEYLLALVPRSKFQVAVDEVYQPLLEDLSNLTSSDSIINNIEPSVNAMVRELAAIIEGESREEKPSVSPLTKWRDKYFERDEAGNYRSKDYLANKKLLSLAEIARAYDRRLRDEGLYDFADMIEEAAKILREDRGFQLSLAEKFQFILLDEFQDTNPSQFELIKLLTSYDEPAIMAVGDDDQAIFEFQGANASNFVEFQNHYNAKVISLVDNYRSTGEILNLSRKIAEQINDSFAKHYQTNKTLRSIIDLERTEPEKATSHLERHEFPEADYEYAWVAKRVANLIQQGENPNSIAVIAPKHKYIAPLLPYFKAESINIAYEKRANVLEDERISALLKIARFVYELANEQQPTYRLLEIMSFPFLDVSPLDALHINAKARESAQPTLDYLAQSDDANLQNLAHWLAGLVMQSYEAPLELWLNYLIGALPLPEANIKSPFLAYYEQSLKDSELLEFYGNLRALQKAVTDHSHADKSRLADLIALVDDYAIAESSISRTMTYRDAEQSVQIMSAHKSKGLEFKYVFLIAVDNWAWGKSKGNNNMFVLPKNLAQIRHTGASDDERLRLLFVAITRARRHLIMTNSAVDFTGREVDRLGYFEEYRDSKSEEQISPFLPEISRKIAIHEEDLAPEGIINQQNTVWSSKYQIWHPDFEILIKANLENYRLSATDLTDFIDIIYAGPEKIYRKQALRELSEPLTPQIAYGNLMHAVFEQVTKQGISDDEALALMQEQLQNVALTKHEIAELAARGERSVKIALPYFAETIRHPGGQAEINFSSERLHLDDIPLTGKIDHINIDAKNKTIDIYDLKTSKYRPEKWQSHPTLYKYALQLEFYKLLLQLSPTYRNYKINTGHILFISPDDEDKVYDKAYPYTAESSEQLKSLIRKVYPLIKSLEFVKNPKYNLSADSGRTLRDVKDFVEVILNCET